MFARSTRGAFVCLKCQTRLARREQQPLDSASTLRGRFRRWQSTAAAKVEDEGDYDDHRDEAVPPQPGVSVKRKPDHKYRKWRPSPVAQLGVPALGKPAEVLVLPSRDRRIPIVPSDDNVSQAKLQESLDAELEPLSPEQLKENIEQVREQYGQRNGQGIDKDWKQLRHNLASGFTAKQLNGYIEQMRGQPLDAVKKFRPPKRQKAWNTVKQQMAWHIVQKIWGYFDVDQVDESVEASTEPAAQATVHFDWRYLNVLLRQKSRPLQALAEAEQVQVDVFREQGNVVLAGNAARVAAAKTALFLLRKGITKSTLKLEDPRQDPRQWKEEEALRFINTLQERYAVYIDHRIKHPVYPSFDIYHHKNDHSVAAIRREMVLATECPTIPHMNTSWPSKTTLSESLVPVYPTGETSRSQALKPWARFLRLGQNSGLSTVSSFTPEEKAAFGDVYDTVRNYLRDSHLTLPSSSTILVREEFTARFGQVVFDRSGPSLKLERVQDPAYLATSLFNPRIPLLPQFLAFLDSQKRCSPASSTIKKQPPNAPFFFGIELTPAQSKPDLPVVAIVLTGSDLKLGLKQPLHVHGIHGIVEERKCNLLLPSLPIDVQFLRQAKVDLYNNAGKQNPMYGSLLGQLRTFLKGVAGQGEPVFPPYVRLHIPPAIRPIATDGSAHVQVAEHLEKIAVWSRASRAKHRLLTDEYMVRTAEVIDVASFRLPFSSNFCLNHAMSDGSQWRDGSQMFSLGNQPPFEAAQSRAKFASFFNTAYEVALHVGKPDLMNG